ncbi:unnamed protein product [Amoebophrya sp. A25]|nr:unnamed protein product [Amoebophrya sp. A25]|eukprot:GSA25T00011037001.1
MVAAPPSISGTLLETAQNAAGGKAGKPEQAALAARPAVEADNGTLEILIGDRIVDVTNYIKKHPGGRVLRFMAGTDGTDAFAQFHHRSKRAATTLARLPQREPQDRAELDRFRNVGNQALLADIRALESDLEKEGYFEPSPGHAVYRVAEIIFLHALGAWVLAQVPSGNGGLMQALTGCLVLAAALVMGIAQGRCGWLQHEGGHYSLTGSMKVDLRLQQCIYGVGCGMAGSWWRNQHNKHHATPQKVAHDVDLDTLPLVAFHSGAVTDTKIGRKLVKAWNGHWASLWLKNQAYLFSPIICGLVAFFWQLYLHPRHALRTGNTLELFWMGLRYVVFYSGLMGGLGWSFTGAFGFYVLYTQIAASYIFTNFAVSHTHLPVVGKEEHRNWAEYAAEHTMNCESHPLTNWWMAYLNFQIEHHLWPQMPQFRFPEVAPRVRKLFERHGQKYQVLPYWDAIRITLRNLDSVAHEAIELSSLS